MMSELRPASEGFPFQYRLKDAGEPGIACPTCGAAMRFVHARGHGIVAMCCGAKAPDDYVGTHPYVFVTYEGKVL
ncbi:MAG: hypothetical protein IT337_06505 [Thermomicrobiales bacterium]|nr:hypothetical protein [Thermomicrobiales bacterium]